MYRSLDPEKTILTIKTLEKRINERFPDAGLTKVCNELYMLANANMERADWIARPNYILRAFVAMVIFVIVLALAYSISYMDITTKSMDAGYIVQIAEAALNDLVLISAAIFFLITVENRVKRSRTLEALHELRTIAHVIDMHQLTKDPGRLLRNVILTDSSPRDTMSAYELMRYLDYCSEMLSLTGKLAALYAQNFRDAVVLSAVNELENLTTGLSRKIWQKIMILHKLDDSIGHANR